MNLIEAATRSQTRMAGFLKRLFSKRSPLHAIAVSGDAEAFANALASMDVTLLGTLARSGLPLDSLDQEVLLSEIGHAAEDLAAREAFAPFVYEEDGATRLPFFTSRKATEAFCGAFCGRENRAFQFPAFILDASMLARLAGDWDSVVMDPQSDHELVLAEDLVAALRARWGSPEGESTLSLEGFPESARYLIAPL